jgi:hypothetical protein
LVLRGGTGQAANFILVKSSAKPVIKCIYHQCDGAEKILSRKFARPSAMTALRK